MKRSSTFLTKAQVKGIAKVGKEIGMRPAQVIRLAVGEWLASRKRAARQLK